LFSIYIVPKNQVYLIVECTVLKYVSKSNQDKNDFIAVIWLSNCITVYLVQWLGVELWSHE